MSSTLVLGSGELGAQVIRELLEQSSLSQISVLQRSPRLPLDLEAKAKKKGQKVAVVQCDLSKSSTEHISRLFKDFQIIISCTGFAAGSGTQMRITQAILDAEGPRKLYVPWQFGIDYDKIGRGSGQTMWDEQLDVRALLRGNQDKADWIIISTGMFTSFLFEPSFGIVDRASRTCRALGGWDNKVTVTGVEDIGKCVAAVIAAAREDDTIKNRVLFVGGDTVTYGNIADLVASRSTSESETYTREVWDLNFLKQELDKDPADTLKMYRYAFAKGTGMSWPLEHCWNVQRKMAALDLPDWYDRNHA